LALFLLGTYGSFRFNRKVFGNRATRYFYWSSIRLDSDPMNQRQYPYFLPCKGGVENCLQPQTIWGIEPGPVSKMLMLAVLPAFMFGKAIVRVLGRFGISEVATFLTLMPVLIFAWFYLIGWLIDHRRQQVEYRAANYQG
jgi:hypothetical protein